jgi:hypothetical protein
MKRKAGTLIAAELVPRSGEAQSLPAHREQSVPHRSDLEQRFILSGV